MRSAGVQVDWISWHAAAISVGVGSVLIAAPYRRG